MCAGPVLAAAAITIFKIKQKKIPTCLHGARDGAAGGCGGAAVLVIEVTGSSSYENEINVSNVTKKTRKQKKKPTRLHGDRDNAAGGCGGAAALIIEVTGSRSYKNEKKVSNVTKKRKKTKKKPT